MINIKRFGLLIMLACVMLMAGCAEHLPAAYYEPEPAPVPVRRFAQSPELRAPTPEEAELFPQVTGLPTLYIKLEYIPLDRITRVYVPAMYTLVYGGEGLFNEHMTIKARGAWSYTHPKRPFTVELLRETSWGGLPPATKWIMIANWSDKSLLRNYIVMSLARTVNGDWSPGVFFADVVINGELRGTYLITESIEIHENRLDLDKRTEAVFEIMGIFRCKNGHRCPAECISVIDGHHHLIYKRPGGAVCSHVRADNLEFFREFFAEMQASLSQGYEAYSQFIDVPSFVNWYIVNEFTKNFDSAFTASCYAFFKNGRLHMGPSWDFDTCLGNQDIGPPVNKTDPAGLHVATSPWFRRLMADESFHRLVQERWTELRRGGVFDDFFVMKAAAAERIADSARLNFERWPCALDFRMRSRQQGATFTHEAEVDYVREWAAARIAWLDSQWYLQ